MAREHGEAGGHGSRDCKPMPLPRHPAAACPTRCCEVPRELLNYYDGRFIAARDLRDEQSYLLSRLRLANRLFHGWGTVCGLDVQPHPRDECAEGWVIVTPGLALDCCGREVIVCDRIAVELPKPLPPATRPCPEDEVADALRGYAAEAAGPSWGPYLVCLRHALRPAEPGPVLLDDGCEPGAQAWNRVQESFEIEVRHFDPARHAGCWPWPPGGGAGGGPCPPCAPEPLEGDCFAPDCPCGDCVPLALLVYAGGRLVIDTASRRRVHSTRATLTRITHINWPHGGRITRRQLVADLNQRLEIRFSRPLRTQNLRRGTGVEFGTFEVTYTESQRDLEYIPMERPPRLSEDGCTAVFEIAQRFVEEISKAFVRVRLLGDFLPDIYGNPVDADFLGGLLPTGNGTAGGVFESWFRIGDEHHRGGFDAAQEGAA